MKQEIKNLIQIWVKFRDQVVFCVSMIPLSGLNIITKSSFEQNVRLVWRVFVEYFFHNSLKLVLNFPNSLNFNNTY